MKEVHASFVESCAKVLVQIRMELATVFETDLVEHASEIDDSADFFVRAARIFHHGKDG
jgi:hypothetical protein